MLERNIQHFLILLVGEFVMIVAVRLEVPMLRNVGLHLAHCAEAWEGQHIVIAPKQAFHTVSSLKIGRCRFEKSKHSNSWEFG